MSEPQYAPLEEWMESIFDYRGKTPEKTTAGIPLITAKVIKGGRIETPSEFIAPDAYDEWMRRGMPEAGDVVITTEAPLGEVAQLPKGKVALAQRVITLRGKKGLVDNTFLKYLLLSRPFQEDLEARATGTTVVGIKQSVLRKIDLAFPSFLDQKAIAHILGTLDDKIELNRKTNETLEAMAKALFKSWFVNFDPVRAKAKGRPTGLPGEISDLFPDSFEDSELGKIPRGWSHSPLFDFAQFTNGASHSSQHLNSEGRGLPIVKIGELKNGLTAQTKYWDAPFESKYLVSVGDILLSWSGNPDTSIGTFVWHGEKGLLNQHIFKVTPAGGELRRSFVLLLLKHNQRVFAEIARDKQTTGLGHITIKDLRENFGIKPSAPIFGAFGKMVDPLIASCEVQTIEIGHLASLRDTLLPKLISGEIRIPDAEKLLEEADV